MKQMTREELRAQAKLDDAEDRANDHGIGAPGGPSALRRPRTRPKANAEILRRLRVHHPPLYQLVMEGVITVHRAATTAGFYRGRKNQHKPPSAVEGSTISHHQEMELWFGTRGKPSAFANEDERKHLWQEHRDRLMKYWANNGRRPIAWWKFESPLRWPGFDRERSALWAARLLSNTEMQQLEAQWTEAFYKSCEPGFTFREFTGGEAHLQYLIYHDVHPDFAERLAADDKAA